jgi:hypothetical protein
MTPLDLTKRAPRSMRETLLGYCGLARTIDKLRAELPGGNMGSYLNHDTGFSAFVIKRVGLDMDELRDVVAAAPDESEVIAWIAARVDPADAPVLNAKMESFVVERMSEADQRLVRERHPVMATRSDLSKILDILDAEDKHAFG